MITLKKKWNNWELIAINYLQKHWYKIIDNNYYVKWWEIDIITKFDNKFVFIEVKYRTNINYWIPEESMTKLKKRKFYYAIHNYIIKNKISEENVQADFISILENNWKIQLKHYKNIELY